MALYCPQWWKADAIRDTFSTMSQTMKRLLVVVSLIWFAVWAYVGWRGYTLTSDAYSYIDQLPPGTTVPQPVLTALEAGQAFSLHAVVWGAAVPVSLLLLGWIVRAVGR